MLTAGCLFEGIGGMGLGFGRAGVRVAWHCEINPFRRAVLRHRFPDVALYGDVRDVTGPGVDILAGGFPCTDTSDAGRRLGLAGARSGLWTEMFRLTRDLRPRYLVVENSDGLYHRGLHQVLADLASIGFDAEWDCLSARAFGAPHRRRRIWLVAYPAGERRLQGSLEELESGARQARTAFGRGDRWPAAPRVPGVDDGLPDRVDRAAALGATLVPLIAQRIAERIVAFEGE
jgi:DNA (cytosine-5)-methyltransferase 1